MKLIIVASTQVLPDWPIPVLGCLDILTSADPASQTSGFKPQSTYLWFMSLVRSKVRLLPPKVLTWTKGAGDTAERPTCGFHLTDSLMLAKDSTAHKSWTY